MQIGIVMKEFHNNNFLVNRGIVENNFIVFLQMTLIIRILNGLNFSNLLSGHAFFRMTNICEMNIYFVTPIVLFALGFYLLALSEDNLNAISCICT
jgi:hypothetical protein